VSVEIANGKGSVVVSEVGMITGEPSCELSVGVSSSVKYGDADSDEGIGDGSGGISRYAESSSKL
jgi:hypothetical protein